ncbi:MAG: hypothetical protein ACTSUC_03280 [Promethearchaeota archaeon]
MKIAIIVRGFDKQGGVSRHVAELVGRKVKIKRAKGEALCIINY